MAERAWMGASAAVYASCKHINIIIVADVRVFLESCPKPHPPVLDRCSYWEVEPALNSFMLQASTTHSKPGCRRRQTLEESRIETWSIQLRQSHETCMLPHVCGGRLRDAREAANCSKIMEADLHRDISYDLP